MDKQLAESVLREVDLVHQKFSEIDRLVQLQEDPAESRIFWGALGRVLGEIEAAILAPIHLQHPGLAPGDRPRDAPSSTKGAIDASPNRLEVLHSGDPDGLSQVSRH
jgi:hypothetical protein